MDKKIRKLIHLEVYHLKKEFCQEIGLLYYFCKERFDHLDTLIRSNVQAKSQASLSAISYITPIPQTELSSSPRDDVICVDELTPASKRSKLKEGKVKAGDYIPSEIQFLGRDYLSIEARSLIDSTLSGYRGEDLIIESGNIVMSRSCFEDLLRDG